VIHSPTVSLLSGQMCFSDQALAAIAYAEGIWMGQKDGASW
jgi:hypothetical protein